MANQPPSFAPRERRQRPDSDSLKDAKWVDQSAPKGPSANGWSGRARPASGQAQPRRVNPARPQGEANSVERRTYRTSTPPQRRSVMDSNRRNPAQSNSVRRDTSNSRQVQPPTPVRIAPQRYRDQSRRANLASGEQPSAGRPRLSATGSGSGVPRYPQSRPVAPRPRNGDGYRAGAETAPAPRSPKPRRRGVKRLVLLVIVACLLLWPVGLIAWASSKINHVEALSNGADTPGTTYLIAGSDKRDGGPIQDDTEGQRSDTIMVLHKADNGQAALVSIPRDSWVDIPGSGENKINAAYSFGGPQLLVQTVEELTGLHVDHYVEVGMGGVTRVVDSLGKVNLCLDYDVDDPKSELEWKAGCHDVDGNTALAFARMRYSDPEGDIGRARRQREVVSAVVKKATAAENALNPATQLSVASAAASSLATDPDTGAWSLGMMALALRQASGDELTGVPPISSINLATVAGSAVELDPQRSPEFFQKLRDGNLQKSDFNQAP